MSPGCGRAPRIACACSAPDRSLSATCSTPRGQVLRILADGQRHSGDYLAQALGVTRGAVKKELAGLEAWGLDVEATPESGYLLDRPIDLLNKARILQELDPDAERLMARLDVH